MIFIHATLVYAVLMWVGTVLGLLLVTHLATNHEPEDIQDLELTEKEEI